MRLADLEADSQLDVPIDVGHNVKMLAQDPRYALAWQFIIEKLCRARALSYIPGRDQATDLMVWFEGRRFVGEQLLRIVEIPIPDAEPKLPPARTITEKVRRRAAKQAEQDQ